MALSLKELNQFTPGDYVVHTDHGIGRFSGLVRIPNGDTTQEVLKPSAREREEYGPSGFSPYFPTHHPRSFPSSGTGKCPSAGY